MKRILHWTDGFAPSIGGTEVLVLELARAQARAGHEVQVVAESLTNCPDTALYEGIPVRRFPFTRTILAQDATAIRGLATELGRFRARAAPDHVHVHFNGAAAWFELLSRPPGPPPILTVHAPIDCLRVPEPLRRHILRSAGTVVAVSEAHKACIAGFVPGIGPSLAVVRNGCAEPEATHPLVEDPGGVFRFACLGRLVDTKGFSVVLQARARVEAVRPGACQVFVAGDGPERHALEAEATALGLASRQVAFTGWIAPQDIHAWLQRADAVIVPSTWEEPFGLVAVEAALAGRPVIASRVGGLVEIVIDGVTGWLVPAADPDALAERMLACIDAPDIGRRLGSQARQRAIDEFTIDRCRAGYDRLYESSSARATP
jgi:glycogen(starch) synthase